MSAPPESQKKPISSRTTNSKATVPKDIANKKSIVKKTVSKNTTSKISASVDPPKPVSKKTVKTIEKTSPIMQEESLAGAPQIQIESMRAYGEEALLALLDIARNSASDTARVAAANALLDRVFGKAGHPLDVSAAQAENPATLSPAVAALLQELHDTGGVF